MTLGSAVAVAEESLAAYLKAARERKGLETPADVQRASKGRVHANTVRTAEKGYVVRPEPETLEVLAEVYGLDRADLLRRAGYGSPPEAAPAAAADAPRSERERQVIRWYRALSPRRQDAVDALLEALADATGSASAPDSR